MMRGRKSWMLALASLVLAGAASILATPAAVHASTDPVVVSADGINYADTLPAALFAGAQIVPGQSITRSFWVKNQTSQPGNLAVALRGVTGGDPQLIAALTIRATAGGTGPNVAFSSAKPCASLISAVPLAGGAAMQVDIRLTLSSGLSGLTAQRTVGRFDIPVTLTSTDVPAPSGCAAVTPTPTPTPSPSSGGNSGGGNSGGGKASGSGTTGSGSGTIGTVLIIGAADGTLPAPEVVDSPVAGLDGSGAARGRGVEPNTGRFWQEIDIAGYVVLLVAGGFFAWWRRRQDSREEAYA